MFKGVINAVSRVIIRFYVHLFGIHFYYLNELPKTEPIKILTVSNERSNNIIFKFYIEPINSFFIRFGNLSSRHENSYMVSINFNGPNIPDEIIYYADIRLFIYKGIICKFNEQAWFEILSEICLDFIENQIKQKHKG